MKKTYFFLKTFTERGWAFSPLYHILCTPLSTLQLVLPFRYKCNDSIINFNDIYLLKPITKKNSGACSFDRYFSLSPRKKLDECSPTNIMFTEGISTIISFDLLNFDTSTLVRIDPPEVSLDRSRRDPSSDTSGGQSWQELRYQNWEDQNYNFRNPMRCS